MRIAVTGASGFIGGHVAKHLHAAGHEVFAFGRRRPDRLGRPLAAPYRAWDLLRGPLSSPPVVEAIVHCAARVSDWGRYDEFYAANVLGTRSVLQSFPGARLVHMSSASVYDPFSTLEPLREEDADLSRLRSPYARTKLMAEQVVEESGRDATVLRPHGVYGPGDTTLLPRLVDARRWGRMLAIGDGRNRVTLTHIVNLKLAVDLALRRTGGFETFNIVDPLAETIDVMLRGLLRALGHEEHILYIPTRLARPLATAMESLYRAFGSTTPPLVTHYAVRQMAGNGVLDSSKANRLLGYHPTLTYLHAFAELASNPGRWLGAGAP